jgi:hypothetical protein
MDAVCETQMRGEEMKITKRVFIAGLVCTGFAARAEDAPLEGKL